MAWFEDGDKRVYYEESGSGEPLLLLPGWGGSIAELAGLREALQRSFRVIAADLPGSGKSGPQPRTYTPAYYAEDARTFLAMLEALHATPARIVGFSDGGEYALLMAVLKPEAVGALVAWGSAGTLGSNFEMAEVMASVVDNPIPPMQEFSAYMKATYGEANARIMTQTAAKAFRAVMEAGGNISRSRAGEIRCPALLITGEHDFLAPPALVADTARAIPDADFVQADGASHQVHLERGEWLAETITGWLAKH
ncbi:MAG: alpha/beta fold hydrolase [Hyphomicrobiales bacterium]